MQLMSQADFARHRGVSPPAVSNWKKAGLLVLAEDPRDGRIKVDRDRTDAKLNAKLDPMRGRPPMGATPKPEQAADAPPSLPIDEPPAGAKGAPTLNEERIEQVREQRIGNALKNAQLAGDLVPLADAERRVSEAGRAARDRMQAWMRGIAERFAAEKDARTIMTIGEEGIDQVFAELAAAAMRGDFSGDEDDVTPEAEAEEEAALEAAIAEGE